LLLCFFLLLFCYLQAANVIWNDFLSFEKRNEQ
jgi:hypothetical protein